MSESVKRRKTGTGESGMTLLETVMAVMIFFICAAGVAQLIVQSKGLSDKARDHYVAINIAKNRIERAGNLPIHTLGMLAESNIYVNVNGAQVDEAEANYRRSTVISNVTTNLVEVIVTLEIRNKRNWRFTGEKEVLRTYLTRYATPGT